MIKWAALAFCVAGIFLVAGMNSSFEKTGPPSNPLALGGGPVSRLISRHLSELADDAFHGGAKRDAKFLPQTAGGKFILSLTDSRGGSGASSRKADTSQREYAEAVKRWLGFSFSIDRGNFNAFLAYYNFLVEGLSEVEMDEDDHADEGAHDHAHAQGGKCEKCSEVAKNAAGRAADYQNLEEGQAAVESYLSNCRFSLPLDYYNSAVACWILFETRRTLALLRDSGKAQSEEMSEVLGKVRSLTDSGDLLLKKFKEESRDPGNESDTNEARQYARGLASQIESALKNR